MGYREQGHDLHEERRPQPAMRGSSSTSATSACPRPWPVTVPGKGSDYAMAAVDSKKRPLDGSKTYKLHLPPDIPVKDFWAVTMYDTQTRSQLQTDQQFPTLDSYRKGMKTNADGSIDIYFAPEAPDGKENNWLQTIPDKSWFIALRLYGPLAALDRPDLAAGRDRAGAVVRVAGPCGAGASPPQQRLASRIGGDRHETDIPHRTRRGRPVGRTLGHPGSGHPGQEHLRARRRRSEVHPGRLQAGTGDDRDPVRHAGVPWRLPDRRDRSEGLRRAGPAARDPAVPRYVSRPVDARNDDWDGA